MMKAQVAQVSGAFGAEALVDDGRLSQLPPALYIGALSDDSLEYAETPASPLSPSTTSARRCGGSRSRSRSR